MIGVTSKVACANFFYRKNTKILTTQCRNVTKNKFQLSFASYRYQFICNYKAINNI